MYSVAANRPAPGVSRSWHSAAGAKGGKGATKQDEKEVIEAILIMEQLIIRQNAGPFQTILLCKSCPSIRLTLTFTAPLSFANSASETRHAYALDDCNDGIGQVKVMSHVTSQ